MQEWKLSALFPAHTDLVLFWNPIALARDAHRLINAQWTGTVLGLLCVYRGTFVWLVPASLNQVFQPSTVQQSWCPRGTTATTSKPFYFGPVAGIPTPVACSAFNPSFSLQACHLILSSSPTLPRKYLCPCQYDLCLNHPASRTLPCLQPMWLLMPWPTCLSFSHQRASVRVQNVCAPSVPDSKALINSEKPSHWIIHQLQQTEFLIHCWAPQKTNKQTKKWKFPWPDMAKKRENKISKLKLTCKMQGFLEDKCQHW